MGHHLHRTGYVYSTCNMLCSTAVPSERARQSLTYSQGGEKTWENYTSAGKDIVRYLSLTIMDEGITDW